MIPIKTIQQTEVLSEPRTRGDDPPFRSMDILDIL